MAPARAAAACRCRCHSRSSSCILWRQGSGNAHQMGIPSGWHYDTPGDGWESEWNDAQSRGAVGSGGNVTFYRSKNGSEFALDYETDTSVGGWGSQGIPPQFTNLLASAGSRQRGLLHGRNINHGAPPAAPATPEPTPIVAKPADEFDVTKYQKPIADKPLESRYAFNTNADLYNSWLSRNRPDGNRSTTSSGSTTDSGSSEAATVDGSPDRVSHYSKMLESGVSSGIHHFGETGSQGGGRRMAGSEQFKERLNRYRR